MIKMICIIFGCTFVLSCGNKLSEQELKDLETQAEKGDINAAVKLKNYYESFLISGVELKELKEKVAQGDKSALKKIEDFRKYEKDYNRAFLLAAENGDSESAFWEGIECYWDFTDNINVKENKKKYRKFMEIAIKGGYKESYDYNDGGMSHIDEYKKYYQNQSEEWWDSDSIKTKEQLSEK